MDEHTWNKAATVSTAIKGRGDGQCADGNNRKNPNCRICRHTPEMFLILIARQDQVEMCVSNEGQQDLNPFANNGDVFLVSHLRGRTTRTLLAHPPAPHFGSNLRSNLLNSCHELTEEVPMQGFLQLSQAPSFKHVPSLKPAKCQESLVTLLPFS